MALSRSAVQELYTAEIDRYSSFVVIFQSRRGIQALLESSPVLRNGMRVLDAGCGFGMATFAFIDALRRKNLDYKSIDGFDLTPRMLHRFQETLDARGIPRVQLQRADVLALETLPSSWKDYDLILSASMLEYLPKPDLPQALRELHARLAPDGCMLGMITRKTPETKVLIEWWWHAQRYSKRELLRIFEGAGFRSPTFRRFPWRYFWLNRGSYVVEVRK
ncbi:MAG: class I SAM-dependent methyltransferase [Bryobacteraceae bacterium]|nr:class I SAM-dependent methyltransferase [Bryobacterales bacterium]NUN01026.1 class I SAM-dependent methyltransferase [Bryobacteraceae bacterium]